MRFYFLILLAAVINCSTLNNMGAPNILGEFQLKPVKNKITHPIFIAAFTSDEVGGRLSPDGKWLIYTSNQKGSQDIWLKDLTKGTVERLTKNLADDIQPTWSPDGKQIAFVSMRQDVKGDIYLCNVNNCSADKVARLTDNHTSESFPVFSANGKSIYFASGPEGQSRIERIDLNTKERKSVTSWGATHPAISPNGKFLAFTFFDESYRGKIAVMNFSNQKINVLTKGEYHAGFPAFTPNSKKLIFSRFYRGPPNTNQSDNAIASLWQIDLDRAIGDNSQKDKTTLLRQLTSDRYTALFAQAHRDGIVYTTKNVDSFDIALIPIDGSLPIMPNDSLMKLAEDLDDPWDQLFVLGQISDWRSQYKMSTIFKDVGEFEKAKTILKPLVQTSTHKNKELSQLAKIDLIALPMEQMLYQAKQNNIPINIGIAKTAYAKLQSLQFSSETSSRAAAYLLLRIADTQRVAKMTNAAISTYETLLARYPNHHEIAVAAKFFLGILFSQINDPTLLSDYYLSLFTEYPSQKQWLQKAARLVLDLYSNEQPALHIQHLRILIDQHKDKPLFGAVAQFLIGSLYEKIGDLDLAIYAMNEVTKHYSMQFKKTTQAAFELGRLCLKYSDELRKKLEHTKAREYYAQAIAAYQRIRKAYPKDNEYHKRAKKEYLRLSLLDGLTLERQGEKILAKKRYREILKTDPDNIRAHRRLILLTHTKDHHLLIEHYQKRIKENSTDYIGYYALGLLATFKPNLSYEDLQTAHKYLSKAIQLFPRDPFGHMTLGWVYEMKERFAQKTNQGYLEEAIVLYERAHSLNDAKDDIQTESDLLTNLCHSFANLGNGWQQAYEYCEAQEQLDVPFLDQKLEAYHKLIFARAASALGYYKKAERLFDQSLQKARNLKLVRLESEITARRALNSLLQKNYSKALQFFKAAINLFKNQNQYEPLTSLTRNIAYSFILQGQHKQALDALDQADELLSTRGMKPIESWPKGVTPANDRSTAPFGFDELDEKNLHFALQGMVYEQNNAWLESLNLLKNRLANREHAQKKRKDEELDREIAQLENKLGLMKLDQGQEFSKQLEHAIQILEKLQTTKKEFLIEPYDFALQVALTLNWAEQILYDPYSQKNNQQQMLARLQQLEKVREQWVLKEKRPLLSTRLRLALWTNLALLNVQNAQTVSSQKTKETSNKALAAIQTLNSLETKARPWIESVKLLRQVFEQTRPDSLIDEPIFSKQDKGTLNSLWQPLTPMESILWHVYAGFNLAQTASFFVPQNELPNHGSTKLLQNLIALCEKYQLAPINYVLEAELAFRNHDMVSMQKVIGRFLDHSPFLLDSKYKTKAGQFRSQIFDRAIQLAITKNDLKAAFAFYEQKERREFVDNLSNFPFEGVDSLAQTIKNLRVASSKYQSLLKEKEPFAQEKQTKLQEAKNNFENAFKQVNESSFRIGSLFTVGPFPYKEIIGSLAPKEILISSFVNHDKVFLVLLSPSKEPIFIPLKAVNHPFKSILENLTKDSSRVYIDLGRIDPNLPVEKWLPNQKIVRLATAWELLDAKRNVAGKNGVVAGSKLIASDIANALGFTPISDEKLTLQNIMHPFERAGILVWASPLRFDNRHSINPRLLLHDPKARRLNDLHLAKFLGMSLRGRILVVANLHYTANHIRSQQIALNRLVHTMGIPSIIIADSSTNLSMQLSLLIKKWDQQDLASLVHSSKLILYGDGGLSPNEQKTFAQNLLNTSVQKGVQAFKNKQLTQTIDHLETALLAMEYLQNFKYQDGALLFLANAYTLLKDYDRATFRMQQLIDLRTKDIELAKKANKGILAAQAKWVQAIQSMAWLYFRNKQYAFALENNAKAISLYNEVKKPLLAIPAHGQRSIIAEEKGDMKEALLHADLAFQKAKKNFSLDPKNSSARDQAIQAALRIARILRLCFSEFDKATNATKEALALTDSKEPQPKIHIQILLEIARIGSAKGDFQNAVQNAEQSLSLSQKYDPSLQDTCLLEIVNDLYYLGAYKQALQKADQGLLLAKNNKLRQIQFFNAKGTIYALLGQTKEAILALRDHSLKFAIELNIPSEIAASYNNLGNALRQSGKNAEQLQEAKESFLSALEIDLERNDKLGMSFDYANLGLVEAQAGNDNEASQLFEHAIKISQEIGAPLNELKSLAGLARLAIKNNKTKDALEHAQQGKILSQKLGLRNWIWRFCLLLGQAFRKSKNIALAQKELEAGMEIVDKQPPRLRRALGIPKIEEDPDDLYDELIDLLATQNKIQEAFILADRFRDRSFVDLISKSATDIPLEKIKTALQKVKSLQIKLESVLTNLASKKPNTLILSYYPTRNRLIIWALQNTQLRMFVVPVTREQLSFEIQKFRKQLVNFNPVYEQAKKLYDWLLKPVLNEMGQERLVVVPVGPLHFLPFAALYDGKDFVVKNHIISFLPSVNSLQFYSGQDQLPKENPVSFAWAGPNQDLVFTKKESLAFGQTFANSKLLQEKNATIINFKDKAPNADLLHIATHTDYREDSPLLSSIFLDDGKIDLFELIGLNFKAALVILSACNTGLGHLEGADGIVGFHQAFLIAGAQRVISSLWRVNDLTTALLMKHFFRQLKANQSIAKALWSAQNILRKRFIHPGFWAGFRMDGAL